MPKTKITPLYERLSHDDEVQGGSFSIQNQQHFKQIGRIHRRPSN